MPCLAAVGGGCHAMDTVFLPPASFFVTGMPNTNTQVEPQRYNGLTWFTWAWLELA